MRKTAAIVLVLFCGSAGAMGAPWPAEVLAAKAEAAEIEMQLVLDPARRTELVEALRERIERGYEDEQVFISRRDRLGKPDEPPEEERSRLWNQLGDEYFATKGKGFKAGCTWPVTLTASS